MSSRWFRLYGVRRSPALFVTSCVAVALATFVASGLSSLSQHASEYGRSLLGLGSAVVYLKAGAKEVDARRVATACEAKGAQAVLVSPEQNTGELARLLGEAPDKLASFSDLLGWTVEVRAEDPGVRKQALDTIANDPMVEVSDDGSAFAQRAHALGQMGDWLGWLLLLCTFVVAAFVINMTVSLALLVRREELQIQRIVGADDWFVMAPLWVEATLTGLFGGVVGMTLCHLTLVWANLRFTPTLQRLGLTALRLPSLGEWTSFVGAAIALTIVGTTLAGLRHLWSLE